MSVHRRKYDSDFKRNAVLLSEDPDRTIAEIADNLGIARERLYKQRKEYRLRKDFAFPGHGREALTPQEQRIRDLENKLRDAEMERDILKKAMAIFSKSPK